MLRLERRYLRNGKSDRRETKSGSKGKNCPAKDRASYGVCVDGFRVTVR